MNMYGVSTPSLHHYPHSLAGGYGLHAAQGLHQRSSLASMYSGSGLGYSPTDWGLGSTSHMGSTTGSGLLGHRDRREYLSCAVNSSSPLTAGGLAASSAGSGYTMATPAVASTYPGINPYTVPTGYGDKLGSHIPGLSLTASDPSQKENSSLHLHCPDDSPDKSGKNLIHCTFLTIINYR